MYACNVRTNACMTWSCTCVTYAHEPSTQCACIVSMYLGAINRRQLYVSPISVYALRTRKGCAEPCRVLHVSSWITSDIAFGCVSVHNKVDVGCCVDYSKSNANRSIVKLCIVVSPSGRFTGTNPCCLFCVRTLDAALANAYRILWFIWLFAHLHSWSVYSPHPGIV